MQSKIEISHIAYYPDSVPLDSFSRSLLDQVIVLIVKNSLHDIIQIFERLHPDNAVKILDYTSDGYTLLYLAIKLQRFKITKYLIQVSRRRGVREMCEQWKLCRHPLYAAMNITDPTFAEYIVPLLHDINDNIYGSLTPLLVSIISRCEHYVDLVIEAGADVNALSVCGISPLMIAIRYPKICRSLLTTNVNINFQDSRGNTAVHVASGRKLWQSMIRLVEAGADILIRNNEDITPLMVASITMNLASFRFLSRRGFAYTELERIEALEVLGATNFFSSRPFLIYWNEALELRGDKYIKSSPYPPRKILDFSKEFTEKTELEGFKNISRLQLAFQGLLIVERVLGRNSVTYLEFMLKTVVIAKSVNDLPKVRQLVDHIFVYFKTVHFTLVTKCAGTIGWVFNQLTEDLDPENLFQNGTFLIFKLVVQVIEVMSLLDKDQLVLTSFNRLETHLHMLDLFLYMTSVITYFDLSKQRRDEFLKFVAKLLKVISRTFNSQSVLHHIIPCLETQPWATVELIQTLVECGADLNDKDSFNQTPLMYCLKHTPIDKLPGILKIFDGHSVRTDCITQEYIFSLTFAHKIKMLDSHSDLCTLENIISKYRETLADILDNFVKSHI